MIRPSNAAREHKNTGRRRRKREKKPGKREREEKTEEKKRKREREGGKNRALAEGKKRGRSRAGGVPQTETHSPELCNSLLKQSHRGTLSSPAGSPASAPDPSEPPERAARYNIKKEDGARRGGGGGGGGDGGGGNDGGERVDVPRFLGVEEGRRMAGERPIRIAPPDNKTK